ncbi:DNA-3-methyladenine glycosylase family protein [Roseospirillum parvum]|uniref:DNA-3-methyladenine glycosylase II n=1 Tax=Roseospirillum parvum TaxID=83401 RepID=A0A1G7TTD1_9PROT|nr:DNA-3-methyladenine glycosylase [Roseospirillum parvum]SDG37800.1 DNA-3-methyladenine glycosylase II [Roseospirillum parvum]
MSDHLADSLDSGLAHLAAACPRMAGAIERVGAPAPRHWPAGFPTLLRIIVDQQVSRAAGAAIFGRLEAALAPLGPETLAAADDATLRGAGLSRPKMAYARGLSRAILDGDLDLEALPALPDEEVLARLTALKGFGNWSAEMYLLFALGRPDVWAIDDLAVCEGARLLYDLPARPGRAEMRALGEPFRPWRSVACLMMWHIRTHGVGATDG